ncbi:MAG: BatA domain-containing protein [Candidatus Nanohaloarchaeota archaeon QJJ-7]|nr:BatA domain-containing protein [Candidatus Nanohaloarchaeota archaeon QJJ-7]
MFNAAVFQQYLEHLQQYFHEPAGLLVLLALLPLLLLYLMRPEPEERVMPSLMFFMQERREGRMEKALRKLQHNLLLLLHILFVVGVAAAVAGPYIMADSETEKAVVVVDRSASMQDDRGEVAEFVEGNAGRENTLVVVGEKSEVFLEEAGKRELMKQVRGMSFQDVETDIRSGLETAKGYEGSVIVASDLHQTVGSGNAVTSLEQIEASGREIQVMGTGKRNRWGVVDTEPSRGNSTVDIKNFMGEEADIELGGGVSGTVTVPAGSVETIEFQTPPGRTTVELEEDPVPADNTAFVSIPEESNFRVLLISDTGNPYLEKALELINFTSVETVTPHLNEVPEADVYIVGRTERVLRSSLEEIEERVKDGASAVVFASPGIFDKMSSLPVTWTGDKENLTVEIREPRRVLVGETPVFSVRKTGGEQMASHNALVRSGIGDGNIVLYNLRDRDFRHNFLYPVFWKDLMEQMTGRPELGELNVETGESLRSATLEAPWGMESGPVTMTEAGFYTASGDTYAANLESPDESGEDGPDYRRMGRGEGSKTQENLRPLVAALLLLVAVGEFGYLSYRGSL